MKNRVKIARILGILSIICLFFAFGIWFHIKTPEQKFENHAKFFEETYGITISVDNCPEEAREDYTLEFSDNLDKINYNLDTIAKCLEKIPTGLLEEINAAAYVTLVAGDYVHTSDPSQAVVKTPISSEKVMHLILCESVKRGNTEIGGYACSGEYDNYIILLLENETSTKNTFFHELLHILEEKSVYMLECGRGGAFTGWDNYNPKKFKYSMDANKYVLKSVANKEDVYFISEYATKNADEDRAELFAYLMCLEDKSEFDELMQYPNLKKKIKFLDACIMEAYPSITEENCFQWQKWLSTSGE